MLKLIAKKIKQRKCEHHAIHYGIHGKVPDVIFYRRCKDCGLYGDDNPKSGKANKRRYEKLGDYLSHKERQAREGHIDKYVNVYIHKYGRAELHIKDKVREVAEGYEVSAYESIRERDNYCLVWFRLTYDNPECEGTPLKAEYVSNEED